MWRKPHQRTTDSAKVVLADEGAVVASVDAVVAEAVVVGWQKLVQKYIYLHNRLQISGLENVILNLPLKKLFVPLHLSKISLVWMLSR